MNIREETPNFIQTPEKENRNAFFLDGLTEALDLIMWSGRLRLQQYFMALLASLLKTTRKKKTNGPWRVGWRKKGRGVRMKRGQGWLREGGAELTWRQLKPANR